MRDDTVDKDGKLETIMDYVISWTLRMAQNSCSTAVIVLSAFSSPINSVIDTFKASAIFRILSSDGEDLLYHGR